MLFGMASFLPVAQVGVWQFAQVQALGSPAATVSFTGLTGGHFYMLTGHILKDAGVTNPVLSVRLNNDATANYGMARLFAQGAVRTANQSAGQTSMATALVLGANGFTGVIAVISKPATTIRGQMWMAATIDGAGLLVGAEKDFGEWGDGTSLVTRVDVLLASGSFAAASSFRIDRKVAA